MRPKRNIFSFQADDGVLEALDAIRAQEKSPPSRGAMINLLIKRTYCALECSTKRTERIEEKS